MKILLKCLFVLEKIEAVLMAAMRKIGEILKTLKINLVYILKGGK